MSVVNENKEGYKKTKLGWIPEEWDYGKIFEYLDYVDYRGKTPKKTSNGIFLITAKNIKNGIIDYEISKEYIPIDTYDQVMSRGKPEIGDVLITTEAPLGNVAQIDKTNIALAQRVIKYRPKNARIDKNYLKWFFLSNRFQNELIQESTGSTVKGIKGSRLHKLPLILPPLPEQQKIARILTTWDKAIEKTEQLFAKKQEIKKGLMQQLLTGKKRFKEFVKSDKMKETKLGWIPEDWKFYLLKDLIIVKDGTHVTPKYVYSGIPFLRVTDIVSDNSNADKKYISLEEHKLLTKVNKPQKGDILYSKNGTIGVAKLVDWEWEFSIFVSLALLRIKNPENVYGPYLEKWLNSELAKKEIYRGIKQGTVINLHLEEIQKFRIVIPSLKEQQNIASVLITTDKEIENLQNQLEKLKEQKRGLMQKLLTGEVRVKLNKRNLLRNEK